MGVWGFPTRYTAHDSNGSWSPYVGYSICIIIKVIKENVNKGPPGAFIYGTHNFEESALPTKYRSGDVCTCHA